MSALAIAGVKTVMDIRFPVRAEDSARLLDLQRLGGRTLSTL